MAIVAGWLLLLSYIGFAVPWSRARVTRLSQLLGDGAVAVLLVPYLLAAASTGIHLLDVLRWALFLAVPTALLWLGARLPKGRNAFRLLAALALWIPLEPGLFVLLVHLALPSVAFSTASDLLPAVEVVLVPGVRLPAAWLTAVVLALYLFLVRYPIEDIGFTHRIRWPELRTALLGLLAYGLLGIPVALAIDFLKFAPVLPTLPDVALAILAGYLFTALVEELLFRGIIQNVFHRLLGDSWLALSVAAAVFGLSHLNNATPRSPVPNWSYVGMALIAGLVYGYVWYRTKKVTVSAITHMLVNLLWGLLFR